ncbi:MAG TPA: phosphoribosylamine--glycine ligase [Acidimicrobiaceae bacterium]|nr:phosphoribosylamine--glycine ligase [Acidimicrobiaceae bacterium]HCB37775.1 phosphoribosylamine--glycine ligase [Acidimicrobiaceae bacterium]
MRVCVVGSGGREHALADVLARTAEVVVAPGSPGIPGSVGPPAEDIDADLFVVGPEAPLAAGLADRLRAQGRLVFGPGADGARLESSKAWMKELVVAAGVPTARHAVFDDAPGGAEAAAECLAAMSPPYVVKTDGLAAGKGVLVTDSLAAAVADVGAKLSGEAFGDAGRKVVVEEGLTGAEVSLFAVCDGRRAVALPTAAQDHKRLGDGDTGPNTGGMGCFSPVPGVGPAEIDELARLVFDPTMDELVRRGIEYRGVLYAGVMLTPAGPRLLEFNVRFGDPEAQVILPRIESDLAELLAAAAAGDLTTRPRFADDAMVCVVCAAEGYPAAPRTGDVVEGLAAAAALDGVTVYAAGVACPAGELVTAGGRVLGVCGRGPTTAAARARAYAAVERISWPGMQYRTDIAACSAAGR